MLRDDIHGHDVTKLESGEAFCSPRLVNEGFPFETGVLPPPPSTWGGGSGPLAEAGKHRAH